MAGGVARSVQVVTGLMLVPLMLGALSNAEYGVWLTLQSMLSLSVFADCGLGNSAMNAITAARAKGEDETVNRIVSAAVVLLLATAITIVSVGCLAWPMLANAGFFTSLPADAADRVVAGVVIYAVYFAILPAVSFIERVCLGFHDGAVNEVARAAAALLGLGATWATVRFTSSFAAICIAGLAPSVACWMAEWWYMKRRHSWLSIDLGATDKTVVRSLLQAGSVFFAIQTCAVLAFSLDSLLIFLVLGPEEVDQYGIPQRVFSLLLVGTSLVLTPLWPAYGEAVSHGDAAWIKATLHRSTVLIAASATVLAVIVAVLLPTLLAVWVGSAIRVSPLMATGLAVLTVFQSIGYSFAVFWNGTGKLRPQLIVGILLVACSLPAKLWVLRDVGLDWMPWVSALIYAVTTLVPAAVVTWRQACDYGSCPGSGPRPQMSGEPRGV